MHARSLLYIPHQNPLIHALKFCIPEHKMIWLANENHAGSLIKKDGKYIFYDSNEKVSEDGLTTERVFENVEQLELHIEKQLFQFQSSIRNMFMNIKMFRKGRNNEFPFSYPNAEEMLKQFFKKNNDKERIFNGNSGLLFALRNGTFKDVEVMVKAGANVNVADRDGDTLLHDAVFRQDIAVVKLLIAHNANLNARNFNNKTPLDYVFDKNDEIIKILIDAGADINATYYQKLEFQIAVDSFDIEKILVAIELGYLELVTMLIARGAELNEESDYSVSALRTAVYLEKPEIVKLLLKLINCEKTILIWK